MAITLPTPVRVLVGVLATGIDRVRSLPEDLPTMPVTIAGQAMRLSMRVQQEIAELATRGDQLLAAVLGGPEEDPAWARFDDEEAAAPVTDIRAAPSAVADGADVARPADLARAADLADPTDSADLRNSADLAGMAGFAGPADVTPGVEGEAGPDDLRPSAGEPTPPPPPASARRQASARRKSEPAARRQRSVSGSRRRSTVTPRAARIAPPKAAPADPGASTPPPGAAPELDSEPPHGDPLPSAASADSDAFASPSGAVPEPEPPHGDPRSPGASEAPGTSAPPPDMVLDTQPPRGDPQSSAAFGFPSRRSTPGPAPMDLVEPGAPDTAGTSLTSAPEGARDGDVPAAETSPAVLPGYDSMTLAQVRGHLRELTAADVGALLALEQAGANRAPFLTLLSNRLVTLDSQAP
jgi:hypothetical protein